MSFMHPFHERYPELAKKESRSIHLPDGDGDIPPGDYLLVESYCTDPKCDCRRVVLMVWNGTSQETAATIGLGFDRDDPLAVPILDPLNRQSAYAESMLKVVAEIALDAEYMARLERHYRMMKDKDEGSEKAEPKPWWKQRPKKPKRRGWQR
jgi:hypothetical protein